ncbi:hypothetical protein DDZ13_01775 [Coraliomargarita sinensis]|uniref:HTH araC/xylS-type domain-containing protein n=1 Tax=Coraliomargarita sinensis TaxID=2174842 RepID=A0A317ZN61_9BACT|nr:helix-turn-helix domain-containing protein [Coraliomargarita sinensis]PXA05627.1 hypothetical protein DDZ13_01775 [Coraliomargarita sinensis]
MAKNEPVKSIVIEDVAEQRAMQPWVDMEFFQMGRGKRVGRMASVDLAAQQVVQEKQDVAVQKLGVMPDNICTVSCCAFDPDFRFSEIQAGETDAVFLLPGNAEFDVYVPAGAQTSYISFDQNELIGHLRVLDPERWEYPPKALWAIPGVPRSALESLVRQFYEVARSHGVNGRDRAFLRQMLLHEVAGMVTSSRGQDVPAMDRLRAFRVCRAALGYVEDRLSEDVLPTITDLCLEFGVSERTLQYGFQSYVNMSPQSYLRLCRLNRVRAVLRAPTSKEITVTEVATRFGFFHMGKFAQFYRLHFGETPSITLARGLKLMA